VVNLDLESFPERLVEGMIAGIAGIVMGYITDASPQVLLAIGIPWYFWILWFMILVADFAMGFFEVVYGGIVFALGILIAGILLANPSTFLTGLLGLLSLTIGVASKRLS